MLVNASSEQIYGDYVIQVYKMLPIQRIEIYRSITVDRRFMIASYLN